MFSFLVVGSAFAPDFVVVAVDCEHVAQVAEEWGLRGQEIRSVFLM